MTSKGDSLAGILLYLTYKGEMFICDIILRDFRKISDWIAFLLLILYGVLHFDLLLCDDF